MDFDPLSVQSYDAVYRGDSPGGIGAIWHIDDAQPRIKELAALGVLRGEIADIGCGLGSSVIYLARRGYSVTGLDSSPAAIAQATERARSAGVHANFSVADATELSGYEGAFDTAFETGLYHCLDRDAQNDYAAAVYRAVRPGGRWFIYCFSTHTINGAPSPLGVPEGDIRQSLAQSGWAIDYFGSTVYQFDSWVQPSIEVTAGMEPRQADALQQLISRMAAVADLIPEGEPLYVPVWAVYAHRPPG